MTQIPASSSEPQGQPVPAVSGLIPPSPVFALPVLAWDEGTQSITPDAHLSGAIVGNAVNDHAISAATAEIQPAPNANPRGGPTSLPALSNDDAQAKPLEDASSQVSPTPAATTSANPKSTSAGTRNVGTSNVETVASLAANLSRMADSSSKTYAVNVPPSGPAHNISRGTAETADSATKTLAAVKSEIEPVLPPPTSALPAIIPPAAGSGNFEPTNLQGAAAKSASGKSGVGATQVGSNGDSSATSGKSGDVTAGAKSQTRKDDSQSSSSSTPPDQSTVSAPAKIIDSSQVFSVSGNQSSSATGDGKTATPGVPQNPSDPKADHLDQTSTGVAQGQQGETAGAYPTSQVHSAKLVERVGEAELRLGIRAGEFGSVDVRTSMIRNQFTAEISTERGELGRAMAAELPSLQNRLAEQRVPVANITLQNQTGNQSTASEQQRPRDGQRMYATNSGSGREEGPISALVALDGTAPTSGLDIHM